MSHDAADKVAAYAGRGWEKEDESARDTTFFFHDSSSLGKQDAETFVPHDMAYDELRDAATKYGDADSDAAMVMAMHMPGFGSYNGFMAGLPG